MTCNTAAHGGKLLDFIHESAEILPFSLYDASTLVLKWLKPNHPLSRLSTLTDYLYREQHVSNLIQTPLHATLLAAIWSASTISILPESRLHLFRSAATLLITGRRSMHHHFDPMTRRTLLRRLAFSSMLNDQTTNRTFTHIAYNQALNISADVLSDAHNLYAGAPQQILNELINSGLIICDTTQEYVRFSHLAWQEFFAAEQLKDDEQIVSFYDRDPHRWLETLIWWCSISDKCDLAIRRIQTDSFEESLRALEGAHNVAPDTIQSIIDTYQANTGQANTGMPGNASKVERLFGAIAGGSTPHGKVLLTYLIDQVEGQSRNSTQVSALNSLASTRLAVAAEILSRKYPRDQARRQAQCLLGDVAVPQLLAIVNENLSRADRTTARRQVVFAALDDLTTVNTPEAARVLVPMLWSDNYALACAAAWRVAKILSPPQRLSLDSRHLEIELALSELALNKRQSSLSYIPWVWIPFRMDRTSTSSLDIIAGRVVHLLSVSSLEFAPATPSGLDARLVIPLCGIILASSIDYDSLSRLKSDDGINMLVGRSIQAVPKKTRGNWLKIIRGVYDQARNFMRYQLKRTDINELELLIQVMRLIRVKLHETDSAEVFDLLKNPGKIGVDNAHIVRDILYPLFMIEDGSAEDLIISDRISESLLDTAHATNKYRYLLRNLPPIIRLVLIKCMIVGSGPTQTCWPDVLNGSRYVRIIKLVKRLSVLPMMAMIITFEWLLIITMLDSDWWGIASRHSVHFWDSCGFGICGNYGDLHLQCIQLSGIQEMRRLHGYDAGC